MAVKIISFINQKGGTGKSTLSLGVATALAKREIKENGAERPSRVLVVDSDPQGTASRWAASAPDEKPFPVPVMALLSKGEAGTKIHREIQKFIHNYDYIIVDTPANADSPVPRSALLISDLAVIPLLPSPPDLWSSIGIKEVVEQLSDINENLKSRLVLNRCQDNLRLTNDITVVLESFGIPMFKTKVTALTAFGQAAGYGTTVYDIKTQGGRQAAGKIEDLTDEIVNLLGEQE